MSEMCVDYLDSYRKFFDRFTSSVDLSDQLPVKVAGYNLVEPEIVGAVADWALQYLEQRRCPPFLVAHLVRKVVEEVRVISKIDPISCGFRGESGEFLSLKLMQVCIVKLVDICSRYRDNAELSSLPPPHPLPPVTSCAIKNSRRSMEDRHVVIHDFHTLFNIKGWGPASYYAVLDGHNGIDAAIYSVSHLHQFLAESPHYPHSPVLALRDACIKTDDQFSIKAQRENLHGGTTAVLALLRPKERKLYVAWLGDSQAVLVRQGRPIQIVQPHKPDRPDERERIVGMGGTVLHWGAWRVNGQLAVSRAIGDVEYKPYVTAEPDVEEITLDGTEDFLILACDGLWDFVSERDATNVVYKQLQENPDDLEAVSQRLVALSKEQSSQDNISVVVVFLADPAELAKRRPAAMETASPNPFNGADMFNGQPHHTVHGAHPGPFDDEDFGPETDVDMVDDVLLSPNIASAKALVHGANTKEDDYERQRQQMSEFDDPGDLNRSRDTPTPPAHEVVKESNAENLAESGGEESEEEWNYIPGKDTHQPTAGLDLNLEQEDMSSQLNPNAAEFVPVSPTRLLMMDDAIISASTGFEKSINDIQLTSESDFNNEISQRPGDIQYSNGPKHGDDYFLRDNFSTLRNKGKDFDVSAACPDLATESIMNFGCSNLAQENVPFDKLAAVQNIEEKVTSGVLEKAGNIFGNNEFSNTLEPTNIFGKSDPMTTSVMGLKALESLPTDQEDVLVPGTPKSTTVEAPGSPISEAVSPSTHDIDSAADDFVRNTHKSPDLISPIDGLQEGQTSGQERTSSSGFESESGAEETDTNMVEENNDGFITEHRRSPPLDLSFKPIETFSDTNPFGTLQTPSYTSPLDELNEINKRSQEEEGQESQKVPVFETPRKVITEKSEAGNGDEVPDSSFISTRTPGQEETVPFHNLESPEELPQFLDRPSITNSSLLSAEVLKPSEFEGFDCLSPVKTDIVEADQDAHFKTDDIVQDSSINDTEETSFTINNTEIKEVTSSHEDLDTTEGFLIEESKILQDEKEFEQVSKLDDNVVESELGQRGDLVSCKDDKNEAKEEMAAFDNMTVGPVVKSKTQDHNENKDSDVEVETKEMKLEFESHITNSQSTPEENVDDEFEVISKEELTHLGPESNHLEIEQAVQSDDSDVQIINQSVEKVDLTTPEKKETNPFKIDDLESLENTSGSPVDNTSSRNEFINSINEFNEVIMSSENATLFSSPQDQSSQVEPEATKTVSYQTLTPADEPQIMKSDSYVTGVKEDDLKLSLAEETNALEEGSPHLNITKEDERSATITEKELVTDTELVTETEPVVEKEPVIEKEQVVVEQESIIKKEPVVEKELTEQSVQLEKDVAEPVQKSEPCQSQVVTETLITALEETSEVPSTVMTEVPSSTGTPPPTPAPGLDNCKELDTPKTDILVAAVAAAGAVAAGSAIVTEVKKTKESVPAKKPATAATKKITTDVTTKPSAKPSTAKVPAAKSAPAKSTTKSTAPVPKLTTTKPTSAQSTVKKTTAAPMPKPALVTNKTVPATSKPKQLSVNKTAPTTPKTSSKPPTPTTPTTPKSPMSKSDVKSSPKPGMKSPLTKSSPTTTKSTTDKPSKPLTNGDSKPIPKKTEAPAKKLTASTNGKSASSTKPTSGAPKPAAAATKAPTNSVAKSTASKPASKPAPAPTKTAAPAAGGLKKPATVAKAADKNGKEVVNKQISSAKPAVNGKIAPAKSVSGIKKTDTKNNTAKPASKPTAIKKPEEGEKVDKSCTQLQEDSVTTTNGFAEHIEVEGIKKLDEIVSSPVIVGDVN